MRQMNNELSAYDLFYNLRALQLCLRKRGHPNVTYEDNEILFEKKYEEFKKEYYTPNESFKICGLFNKKNSKIF
jgi:hypothetical protein